MQFFKKHFTEVDNWSAEEVVVRCPFHNDIHPSASINTQKSLFHCWVCDIGYSEEQFVAKINNIPTAEAIKLLDRYDANDDWDLYKANLWADTSFLNKVRKLGLSDTTINNFKLGLVTARDVSDKYGNIKMLGIPVFYNNLLVDVRAYNLNKNPEVPKLLSKENAQTGWVIPYDIFLSSNETCYMFEGEKDMLMAREQGINAYTLSGGAGAVPNQYVINSFRDKNIVICYDNDDAGKDGMLNIFKTVKDLVKSIRYISIGDVVKEEKEDFYDFVTKYNCDAFDFYGLEQRIFRIEDIEKDNTITIKKALENNLLRKNLKSEITVAGEFADPYSVPTIVEFIKEMEAGGKRKEAMFEGEKKSWYLEQTNIVQLLELIEVSAKDAEIKGKLRGYVGISSDEPNVKTIMKELRTIYKTSIVDKDIDGGAISLDMYSFEKLDVGGQYMIEYKVFPHPTKNQKLVAVCFKSTKVHDNRNYSINTTLLSKFKSEGSIEDRLKYLYASAKHHIADHLDFNIWLISDLVFNSILDFNYGKPMRGALDIFLLGDTHVGKSETNSKLVELYNFGHFLSLKTSTTVGLIGGSNKVDGSWCNTIGAIPRQHKRLVVLEEFSGARQDFIKTMTDIRSSNELRLSRASGELVVPCKLRMITISNPLNDEHGSPKFLNTFPNGIMPIMELIKSAEDVARYDGFLLIPTVGKRFNPFDVVLTGEPIPVEAYRNKINWVATRQPDNVKFEEGVEGYIWEKAEELNKIFECNFPLFGVTTCKKLARFCVALATLIVNTSDDYENVIVSKEIVDYMCKCLIGLYDNSVFRLKEYADEYKSYSTFNDDDVKELEKLYSRNATLLTFLNGQSRTTRSNLSSVSGLNNEKFNPIFNKLVADKYIRLSMDNVYPTDKFRKVFVLIKKDFSVDAGTMIGDYSTPAATYTNDLSEVI